MCKSEYSQKGTTNAPLGKEAQEGKFFAGWKLRNVCSGKKVKLLEAQLRDSIVTYLYSANLLTNMLFSICSYTGEELLS